MKQPKNNLQALFRAIPSVQQLQQHPRIASFRVAPEFLTVLINRILDQFRQNLPKRKLLPEQVLAAIIDDITAQLRRLTEPTLRPVINATGIILHTNLGRAVLPASAVAEFSRIGEHYCNIELDLTTGKRGQRLEHVEPLLQLLTGAEAAAVVNNCAAAVFLTLRALCFRKEVPVSRGELVEIGGSFRMPEVMRSSGAKMVEIGTTNKTHLRDYEGVISGKTGAILKVHTSNYRVVGFTTAPSLEELIQLAQQRELPLIYDLGSGLLTDIPGLPIEKDEPKVKDIVAAGVDVAMFSGDKLLGGPQCGIIVGKKKYVDKIRKHHLMRAMRCDKMTLAALSATLRLYLQPATLPQHLPAHAMLSTSVAELTRRAELVCRSINNPNIQIEITEADSQIGSGALPLKTIPSVALAISGGAKSEHYHQQLRDFRTPVIAYIRNDRLLVNLRTILERDTEELINAINALH